MPHSAQIIPPGGSLFNPPLPPPLPPPKIEAPVVPQMDAPPRQSYTPAPRPSFSDRITTVSTMPRAGSARRSRGLFALLRQLTVALSSVLREKHPQ